MYCVLVGPAGGVCGQAGSYLATWIPDITPGSCRRHDDCYSSCAKQCKDYSCKKDCDNEFLKKNPAYGAFVVIAIGDKAYRDALTLNGCECVNPEN